MRNHRRALLLGLTVGASLLCSGCRGDGDSAERPATIAQPALADERLAPQSSRVDLDSPRFSHPTSVSNPLFPVSQQKSVLLLGRVDGKPFRTEVTLLPETRIVEWQGRRVETLVSQYVAFLDGRIHEVAYDLYAQDDDGAVWYFGEDVFNFGDGVITDTHGTWLAGRDGPAAMIMPAEPKVGDVYRPENIPGLVFEEVTVKAVGRRLAGSLGAVEGGLVVEEFHLLDNAKERKTFAPGYGEFLTGGDGDVEALALEVPTDALAQRTPAQLATLANGATDVFDAAGKKDWTTATARVREVTRAWRIVRAGEVPNRLRPQLEAALDALTESVSKRRVNDARSSAIEVARWSLDLQLRHRPVAAIDLARFDLWAAQILVDAAAGDAAAVNGDLFTLDYVRDRIGVELDQAELRRINTQLEALGGAVADEDLEAASASARHLRKIVAGVRPLG
jgi:hypothetical protein